MVEINQSISIQAKIGMYTTIILLCPKCYKYLENNTNKHINIYSIILKKNTYFHVLKRLLYWLDINKGLISTDITWERN